MQVKISFINDFQRRFFACTKRNQCASGGYGNGKTAICSQKIITLAAKFPKYRAAIFRRSYKDLAATTRPTFFKFCPKELYDPKRGGHRADSHGYLRLINGSEILFMHSDDTDHNIIRGLEINAIFVDQCEEVAEQIYSHLDSRVGRWDQAEIPPDLNPDKFPKNPATGRPMVPSYMMIACNPDDYSHYIYRWYHPDSEEYHETYYDEYFKTYYCRADTHEMFQAAMTDNPALDPAVIRTSMAKGKDFKRRFVRGEWGITEGKIHEVSPLSILQDIPRELYEEIINKGIKIRVYDHGLSAPSCCLWFSFYKDWVLCYREYYKDNTLISEHRQNIHDLSLSDGIHENYALSLADPAIFKKSSEKYGGFWTTADDFTDPEIDAPPIYWSPADNNEFMTRDRIDEMLMIRQEILHPISGEPGAPKLYFLKKSKEYPRGCHQAIIQLKAQRKVSLGEVGGETHYSEERDKAITDHAYDPIRYLAAQRIKWSIKHVTKNLNGTFIGAMRQVKTIGNRSLYRPDGSTLALY